VRHQPIQNLWKEPLGNRPTQSPAGGRKGNLKNKKKGQDGWSGRSDGMSIAVALKLVEGQIIIGHKGKFPFCSEYDENSLACLKQWNDMTLFVFFIRLF